MPWKATYSFVHVSCSACFLIEARTASPGMAPSLMDWAFYHQSLIKEMSYSWIFKWLSCNWDSLLSSDSSLCQVDTKLASTLWLAFFHPHNVLSVHLHWRKCLISFLFFLLLLAFQTGFLHVALAGLELSWSQTQRSTCFCLPRAEVKFVCSHTERSPKNKKP